VLPEAALAPGTCKATGILYGSFILPPSLTIFVLCSTELDMEDEEFRWDAATFESIANTNATTNSATIAKKQLVESHYNTTWRAPRGTDNENTDVSAELGPQTPEFVLGTLCEENPQVIHTIDLTDLFQLTKSESDS
jgi:hypothetical protein